MSYQANKRHGGNLHAYEEVDLKRKSPTVGIQIYDVLEKVKLWRQTKNQWLPGLGEGEERVGGAHRDFQAV